MGMNERIRQLKFVCRATDNWKTLKELEKAVKVYWGAKDRLPPRVNYKYSFPFKIVNFLKDTDFS